MAEVSSLRIPKLTNKELITKVNINKPDVQSLISDITKKCLDINFHKEFTIEEVSMVHNSDLQAAYVKKRSESKEEGRNAQSLADQLGFLSISPHQQQKLARDGLEARPLFYNRLGKSEFGVYLNRYFDTEVKHAWANQSTSASMVIVVFKYFSGKCKSIAIGNLYSNSSDIEPTPNYDCHIGNVPPSSSESLFCQRAKSEIYLYEYDDMCEPIKRPRQCLPYAIIKIKRISKKNVLQPIMQCAPQPKNKSQPATGPGKRSDPTATATIHTAPKLSSRNSAARTNTNPQGIPLIGSKQVPPNSFPQTNHGKEDKTQTRPAAKLPTQVPSNSVKNFTMPDLSEKNIDNFPPRKEETPDELIEKQRAYMQRLAMAKATVNAEGSKESDIVSHLFNPALPPSVESTSVLKSGAEGGLPPGGAAANRKCDPRLARSLSKPEVQAASRIDPRLSRHSTEDAPVSDPATLKLQNVSSAGKVYSQQYSLPPAKGVLKNSSSLKGEVKKKMSYSEYKKQKQDILAQAKKAQQSQKDSNNLPASKKPEVLPMPITFLDKSKLPPVRPAAQEKESAPPPDPNLEVPLPSFYESYNPDSDHSPKLSSSESDQCSSSTNKHFYQYQSPASASSSNTSLSPDKKSRKAKKKSLLPLPKFNADGSVSNVLRGIVDGNMTEIEQPTSKPQPTTSQKLLIRPELVNTMAKNLLKNVATITELMQPPENKGGGVVSSTAADKINKKKNDTELAKAKGNESSGSIVNEKAVNVLLRGFQKGFALKPNSNSNQRKDPQESSGTEADKEIPERLPIEKMIENSVQGLLKVISRQSSNEVSVKGNKTQSSGPSNQATLDTHPITNKERDPINTNKVDSNTHDIPGKIFKKHFPSNLDEIPYPKEVEPFRTVEIPQKVNKAPPLPLIPFLLSDYTGANTENLCKDYNTGANTENLGKDYNTGANTENLGKDYNTGANTENMGKDYNTGVNTENLGKDASTCDTPDSLTVIPQQSLPLNDTTISSSFDGVSESYDNAPASSEDDSLSCGMWLPPGAIPPTNLHQRVENPSTDSVSQSVGQNTQPSTSSLGKSDVGELGLESQESNQFINDTDVGNKIKEQTNEQVVPSSQIRKNNTSVMQHCSSKEEANKENGIPPVQRRYHVDPANLVGKEINSSEISALASKQSVPDNNCGPRPGLTKVASTNKQSIPGPQPGSGVKQTNSTHRLHDKACPASHKLTHNNNNNLDMQSSTCDLTMHRGTQENLTKAALSDTDMRIGTSFTDKEVHKGNEPAHPVDGEGMRCDRTKCLTLTELGFSSMYSALSSLAFQPSILLVDIKEALEEKYPVEICKTCKELLPPESMAMTRACLLGDQSVASTKSSSVSPPLSCADSENICPTSLNGVPESVLPTDKCSTSSNDRLGNDERSEKSQKSALDKLEDVVSYSLGKPPQEDNNKNITAVSSVDSSSLECGSSSESAPVTENSSAAACGHVSNIPLPVTTKVASLSEQNSHSRLRDVGKNMGSSVSLTTHVTSSDTLSLVQLSRTSSDTLSVIQLSRKEDSSLNHMSSKEDTVLKGPSKKSTHVTLSVIDSPTSAFDTLTHALNLDDTAVKRQVNKEIDVSDKEVDTQGGTNTEMNQTCEGDKFTQKTDIPENVNISETVSLNHLPSDKEDKVKKLNLLANNEKDESLPTNQGKQYTAGDCESKGRAEASGHTPAQELESQSSAMAQLGTLKEEYNNIVDVSQPDASLSAAIKTKEKPKPGEKQNLLQTVIDLVNQKQNKLGETDVAERQKEQRKGILSMLKKQIETIEKKLQNQSKAGPRSKSRDRTTRPGLYGRDRGRDGGTERGGRRRQWSPGYRGVHRDRRDSSSRSRSTSSERRRRVRQRDGSRGRDGRRRRSGSRERDRSSRRSSSSSRIRRNVGRDRRDRSNSIERDRQDRKGTSRERYRRNRESARRGRRSVSTERRRSESKSTKGRRTRSRERKDRSSSSETTTTSDSRSSSSDRDIIRLTDDKSGEKYNELKKEIIACIDEKSKIIHSSSEASKTENKRELPQDEKLECLNKTKESGSKDKEINDKVQTVNNQSKEISMHVETRPENKGQSAKGIENISPPIIAENSGKDQQTIDSSSKPNEETKQVNKKEQIMQVETEKCVGEKETGKNKLSSGSNADFNSSEKVVSMQVNEVQCMSGKSNEEQNYGYSSDTDEVGVPKTIMQPLKKKIIINLGATGQKAPQQKQTSSTLTTTDSSKTRDQTKLVKSNASQRTKTSEGATERLADEPNNTTKLSTSLSSPLSPASVSVSYSSSSSSSSRSNSPSSPSLTTSKKLGDMLSNSPSSPSLTTSKKLGDMLSNSTTSTITTSTPSTCASKQQADVRSNSPTFPSLESSPSTITTSTPSTITSKKQTDVPSTITSKKQADLPPLPVTTEPPRAPSRDSVSNIPLPTYSPPNLTVAIPLPESNNYKDPSAIPLPESNEDKDLSAIPLPESNPILYSPSQPTLENSLDLETPTGGVQTSSEVGDNSTSLCKNKVAQVEGGSTEDIQGANSNAKLSQNRNVFSLYPDQPYADDPYEYENISPYSDHGDKQEYEYVSPYSERGDKQDEVDLFAVESNAYGDVDYRHARPEVSSISESPVHTSATFPHDGTQTSYQRGFNQVTGCYTNDAQLQHSGYSQYHTAEHTDNDYRQYSETDTPHDYGDTDLRYMSRQSIEPTQGLNVIGSLYTSFEHENDGYRQMINDKNIKTMPSQPSENLERGYSSSNTSLFEQYWNQSEKDARAVYSAPDLAQLKGGNGQAPKSGSTLCLNKNVAEYLTVDGVESDKLDTFNRAQSSNHDKRHLSINRCNILDSRGSFTQDVTASQHKGSQESVSNAPEKAVAGYSNVGDKKQVENQDNILASTSSAEFANVEEVNSSKGNKESSDNTSQTGCQGESAVTVQKMLPEMFMTVSHQQKCQKILNAFSHSQKEVDSPPKTLNKDIYESESESHSGVNVVNPALNKTISDCSAVKLKEILATVRKVMANTCGTKGQGDEPQTPTNQPIGNTKEQNTSQENQPQKGESSGEDEQKTPLGASLSPDQLSQIVEELKERLISSHVMTPNLMDSLRKLVGQQTDKDERQESITTQDKGMTQQDKEGQTCITQSSDKVTNVETASTTKQDSGDVRGKLCTPAAPVLNLNKMLTEEDVSSHVRDCKSNKASESREIEAQISGKEGHICSNESGITDVKSSSGKNTISGNEGSQEKKNDGTIPLKTDKSVISDCYSGDNRRGINSLYKQSKVEQKDKKYLNDRAVMNEIENAPSGCKNMPTERKRPQDYVSSDDGNDDNILNLAAPCNETTTRSVCQDGDGILRVSVSRSASEDSIEIVDGGGDNEVLDSNHKDLKQRARERRIKKPKFDPQLASTPDLRVIVVDSDHNVSRDLEIVEPNTPDNKVVISDNSVTNTPKTKVDESSDIPVKKSSQTSQVSGSSASEKSKCKAYLSEVPIDVLSFARDKLLKEISNLHEENDEAVNEIDDKTVLRKEDETITDKDGDESTEDGEIKDGDDDDADDEDENNSNITMCLDETESVVHISDVDEDDTLTTEGDHNEKVNSHNKRHQELQEDAIVLSSGDENNKSPLTVRANCKTTRGIFCKKASCKLKLSPTLIQTCKQKRKDRGLRRRGNVDEGKVGEKNKLGEEDVNDDMESLFEFVSQPTPKAQSKLSPGSSSYSGTNKLPTCTSSGLNDRGHAGSTPDKRQFVEKKVVHGPTENVKTSLAPDSTINLEADLQDLEVKGKKKPDTKTLKQRNQITTTSESIARNVDKTLKQKSQLTTSESIARNVDKTLKKIRRDSSSPPIWKEMPSSSFDKDAEKSHLTSSQYLSDVSSGSISPDVRKGRADSVNRSVSPVSSRVASPVIIQVSQTSDEKDSSSKRRRVSRHSRSNSPTSKKRKRRRSGKSKSPMKSESRNKKGPLNRTDSSMVTESSRKTRRSGRSRSPIKKESKNLGRRSDKSNSPTGRQQRDEASKGANVTSRGRDFVEGKRGIYISRSSSRSYRSISRSLSPRYKNRERSPYRARKGSRSRSRSWSLSRSRDRSRRSHSRSLERYVRSRSSSSSSRYRRPRSRSRSPLKYTSRERSPPRKKFNNELDYYTCTSSSKLKGWEELPSYSFSSHSTGSPPRDRRVVKRTYDPTDLDYYTTRKARDGRADEDGDRRIVKLVNPDKQGGGRHTGHSSRKPDPVNVNIKQLILHQFGVVIPESVAKEFPLPLSTSVTHDFKGDLRPRSEQADLGLELVKMFAKKLNLSGDFTSASDIDFTSRCFLEEPFKTRLEEFSDSTVLLEVNVIKQCQAMLDSDGNDASQEYQFSEVMLQKKTLEQAELQAQVLLMEGKGDTDPATKEELKMVREKLDAVKEECSVLMQSCVEFKRLKADKERSGGGSKLPEPTMPQALRVSTDDFKFRCPAEVTNPGSSEKERLRLRSLLDQVAGDILELYHCLGFGRPHYRVPDLILLASERPGFHTDSGSLLILKEPISEKCFLQLLAIKHQLEASDNCSNRAELVRERSEILAKFVDAPSTRRVEHLKSQVRQFRDCADFMRDVIGLDGLKRLKVFETYKQALRWHCHFLDKENDRI